MDRGQYTLPIALAVLMLAGCGGDSGGSGLEPVVAQPAPTPVPTATPTPTYATAFDFTRDRSFQPIGAQITATARVTGSGNTYSEIDATLLDVVNAASFTYVANTQTSIISTGNVAGLTYPGTQIGLRGDDRFVYNAPDGTLSVAQPGPQLGGFPAALRYTVVVSQSDQPRNADGTRANLDRRLVTGAGTIAADVPRSGNATYRILLGASALSSTSSGGYVAQDATLTINYATGAVAGTITAPNSVSNGTQPALVLTFTGQLGATNNRLAGSLTAADGGTGQFIGELYGPQGVEVGLAFVATRSNERIVGALAGARR